MCFCYWSKRTVRLGVITRLTCHGDEYAALSPVFERMKNDIVSMNPKRIGIVGSSLLVQKIVPDVDGCTIILNENILNMSSLDCYWLIIFCLPILS